jgi:hypothetical protein
MDWIEIDSAAVFSGHDQIPTVVAPGFPNGDLLIVEFERDPAVVKSVALDVRYALNRSEDSEERPERDPHARDLEARKRPVVSVVGPRLHAMA